MKILHISVNGKKATYLKRDGAIVCGNSDYVIAFTFDDEWSKYDKKMARFVVNGTFKDVAFTGTTCEVPILSNTNQLLVGVYAGELTTTTRATIPCLPSILCQGVPAQGFPQVQPIGEKGDKGDEGDKGDGVFIRYSASADGSDFTETWSAGQTYIGFAIGQKAPTDKEGYSWSLSGAGQKGDTPVKGVDYWTPEDQAKIVEDVLAAMPNGDEVSY